MFRFGPALLVVSMSVLAGCSISSITCGPGTVQQGGTCVAAGFCDQGTYLDAGACVPDVADAGPPIACGQGTVLQGTTCILATGGAGTPSTFRPSVGVAASSIAFSESPRIAVNSKGEIFIAGLMSPMAAPMAAAALWVSRDRGQTFQLVQSQSAPSAAWMASSSLVIDPADRIAWSWNVQQQTSGAVSGAVFITVSGDDGATFPPATQVSLPDAADPNCGDAWLSLDRSGNLYLSWAYGALSSSSYQFGARFVQSTRPGGNLTAPRDLVSVGFVQMGFEVRIPSSPLAFDPAGNVVGIVLDEIFDQAGNLGSGIIYAIRLTPSGSNTTPMLSPESGRYFTVRSSPILVSDSKGALTAAFVDGLSRQEQLYVTHSADGVFWDTPAPLSEETLASGVALPWLAIDEQDRVHAFWLDNRNGAWTPYTAFSRDGLHFEASEQVGDQSFVEDGTAARSIGEHLSLVVRGGQRYAAWTDTRGGHSQIRFASAPEPQ